MRGLKTTDRQKKPLHDNVTGRECGGDVRGLAGLPQAASVGQWERNANRGIHSITSLSQKTRKKLK